MPKNPFLCVPYVFPVIVGGVDRFVLRDSKTCGKASESCSFYTNSIDYVQQIVHFPTDFLAAQYDFLKVSCLLGMIPPAFSHTRGSSVLTQRSAQEAPWKACLPSRAASGSTGYGSCAQTDGSCSGPAGALPEYAPGMRRQLPDHDLRRLLFPSYS